MTHFLILLCLERRALKYAFLHQVLGSVMAGLRSTVKEARIESLEWIELLMEVGETQKPLINPGASILESLSSIACMRACLSDTKNTAKP